MNNINMCYPPYTHFPKRHPAVLTCHLQGLAELESLPHTPSAIRMKCNLFQCSFDAVLMVAMASQITSLTIVYSTVYSGTDQRKHQRSASLAFVWWIHRGLMKSPHTEWPVTRKMFPFDDVIISVLNCLTRGVEPASTTWAEASHLGRDDDNKGNMAAIS